jgi:hypothetical protein
VRRRLFLSISEDTMKLEFLTQTKGKLIDVNPRSEKRGAHDLVPAVDLRLQVDTTNGALAQLDPDLRDWLYRASTQETLPGVDAVSDQSALRFPELGQPLHWGGEGKGYALTFDFGISPETDIQLHGCKLHKVTFTVKDGGTVQLTFSVSCCEGITREQVGELGTRVQHDVFFTLAREEVALDAVG